MQRLLDQSTVPPDGFRYFQDETKTWIRAPDYFNLFASVRDHRRANNLPIGTFWETEVEDQLCRMLPPGLCKEQSPANVVNVFTRISWDDVVSGTQTVVDWGLSGFPVVTQELANSRANTCSRCYFNVAVGGICGGCNHLVNLAARFTQAKKTASDPYLRACAVCKCSLQVKVWVPIESIDKGTPPDVYSKFPSFCWIRNELDQFRRSG